MQPTELPSNACLSSDHRTGETCAMQYYHYRHRHRHRHPTGTGTGNGNGNSNSNNNNKTIGPW